MEQDKFETLRGEWTGTGKMTMGALVGDVIECVRMEATDESDILSYVRKSQISFPGRTSIHNELGFIRAKSVSLMLHRGTYNILEWDETQGHYSMVVGSSDTRQMTRKITVISPSTMQWYNFMEVQHGASWVTHEVKTDFKSLIIK